MTPQAKLLALLDANAAFASVVNVKALRELDVPCGFCNRESRLCLSQLFKLYSSVLSGLRCSRYSFRFASRFVKSRHQRKMTRHGGREKINSRFGIIPDQIGTLIAVVELASHSGIAIVNESVKYSPRFCHHKINVDARN